MSISITACRGSAIIGLMITAVIVLGSFISLNVAALLSLGNTSRALDVARQNHSTMARIEHATRESFQSVFGLSYMEKGGDVSAEIDRTLGLVAFGKVAVAKTALTGSLSVPAMFPDLASAPAALADMDAELSTYATPNAIRYWAARGRSSVASSSSLTARYQFVRDVNGVAQTYGLEVDCRVVSVPMTRHGIVGYELPHAIGGSGGGATWPAHLSGNDVGPLGLVEGRDPACIGSLSLPRTAARQNRPAHFRNLAALSDAYQYVFSDRYIQRVADYAGGTHFIVIGGGAANPTLDGGSESGSTYRLDLGMFGRGVFGGRDEIKDAVVICAADAGRRLVLTDSGGSNGAVLVLAAGPGGASPVGRMQVEIEGNLSRPVVIVAYNCEVVSASPVQINGAVFLDPESRVVTSTGPFTVGHLSYSAAGGVDVSAFRTSTISPEAEAIAPRVVFAASRRRIL